MCVCVYVCVCGGGGVDLRPPAPSPMIRSVRAMSCSKARSSQIMLVIRL